MGRIGSLFKKSDDKQAPAGPATSNPYAQQQPPPQHLQGSNPYAQDQHETYSQYNANQFNANQHNVNQQYSQGRQGPASGLPSGPRPGGLPSRVAPGPRGSGTRESNDSAFPGYAEQPIDSQPPPPYYSPSLASTGGSPALPSSRASPSVGTGYPREKFGASDGVGRNRFEPSAPSSYDRSASLPSQRQGGYGNLDTANGGLFHNYNGPAKQTTGSNSAQSYASYGTPMADADSEPMTEEERQEAEVQELKDQVTRELYDTAEVSGRARGHINQAYQIMAENIMQTEAQRKQLAEIEAKIRAGDKQNSKARDNLGALDGAQGMWNFAGNSKKAIQSREERKMGYDREHAEELEELKRQEEVAQKRFADFNASVAALDPATQGRVLGGNKASSSKFEFEDDTGEQRRLNEQIADDEEHLLQTSRQLRVMAVYHGEEISRQNQGIEATQELVERNKDALWKNRVHLDTKYLKR